MVDEAGQGQLADIVEKIPISHPQVIACMLDQKPGSLWLALDAARQYPARKFYQQVKAGISQLDDELREPLEAQL